MTNNSCPNDFWAFFTTEKDMVVLKNEKYANSEDFQVKVQWHAQSIEEFPTKI